MRAGGLTTSALTTGAVSRARPHGRSHRNVIDERANHGGAKFATPHGLHQMRGDTEGAATFNVAALLHQR